MLAAWGLSPRAASACSPAVPWVQWSAEVGPGDALIVALQCYSTECPADLGLHLEADGVVVKGQAVRVAEGESSRMLAWQAASPLTEGVEYQVVFSDPAFEAFERRRGDAVKVVSQPASHDALAELTWDVYRVERDAGESACCHSANYCDGRQCLGERGRTQLANLSVDAPGFAPFVLRRAEAKSTDPWSLPAEANFDVAETLDGEACVALDVWHLDTDEVSRLEHCEGVDFEVGLLIEDWTLLTYCLDGPPTKSPERCRDEDGRPNLRAKSCELSASLTERWCEHFGDPPEGTVLSDDGRVAYAMVCEEEQTVPDGGTPSGPSGSSGCRASGGRELPTVWILAALAVAWSLRRRRGVRSAAS